MFPFPRVFVTHVGLAETNGLLYELAESAHPSGAPALRHRHATAPAVAGALARALAMPLQERCARHEALFAAVCEHDVDRWQQEFLATLRSDSGRDWNPICSTLAEPAATVPRAAAQARDEETLSGAAEMPRFAN